ncbi:MAG: type II toxin-antitoxin system HicB family antitoxin [Defluviitaleaceae bacterium]|nr:type II toxin-antitoxin system HicB family antitoxin [Defluviitaleaceae bacterium]
MKYAYPAIFRPEGNGFSIYFPDIGMGGTQGDNIVDGLEMAHDFLLGAMIMLENSNGNIPNPSEITALELGEGHFASFISVDTAKTKAITNEREGILV